MDHKSSFIGDGITSGEVFQINTGISLIAQIINNCYQNHILFPILKARISKMTRINLRVLVIDKLAFLYLASIYNWKETKDDFFTKQESTTIYR
jgi:hypothetical protein